MVGKTWDFQATNVLGVSLHENIDMIAESVEYLSKHALVVYDAEHFFDGFKANQDYALETVTAAAKSGAKWIVFCDTNGVRFPKRSRKSSARLHKLLSLWAFNWHSLS